MSFHALYVYRLAHELNQLLQGASLQELFSTEKNHLFIHFQLKNGNNFTLFFRIEGADMFIYFPEQIPADHRHRLDQFKVIWNLPVRSVQAHAGERSFHIDLGNASLLFLCYGRHASVLTVGNDTTNFPQRATSSLNFSLGTISALAKAHWPETAENFLLASFMTPLLRKNFSQCHSPSEFKELLQAYLEGNIHLNKAGDQYTLDALPASTTLGSYEHLTEALNAHTELHLSRYFFVQSREKLLKDLRSELNACQKRLKALKKQLELASPEKGYRHLGDLLLSHLPQIHEGMDSITLIDYMDGKEIRIPLKEKLSPQDNAQRYYRKAKNQHIQEIRIKEEITKLESWDLEVQEKLNSVENAETMQSLRIHLKEKKKQPEKEVRLPYHRFSFQGYDILVGKQAKDNDELTLKIAKKDDLWLHARDIGGSHVVVRKKAGSVFPGPVIEAAAGLALWFSKRRTESLAPVIYTEKKNVRKRKGDAAGAVVVEKEKVIMASPVAPDHLENTN